MKKLLATMLALVMALTLCSTAWAEGESDNSIDFDAFVTALQNADTNGNVVFDGATHDKAVGGKLTVKWSPVSGCSDNRGDNHTCTVGRTPATGNTPSRENSGNAQYQVLYSSTAKSYVNVTIKNVNFIYDAKDFTICLNSGWAGSFTKGSVPNAQIHLGNTGDTVVENCSFNHVVFTSYNNSGKTEITNCSFSNVYNSYAIKDLGGSTASVTNCIFADCGGAIMTESWNANRMSSSGTELTISNNAFTNVDVEGTNATDKVGTRGVIQVASAGTFNQVTLDNNTATNCGPVLRQLNASFDASKVSGDLSGLVGESGQLTFTTSDKEAPTATQPTLYTVTFANGGHGTAPAAKRVTNGYTITMPTMADDGYFKFQGWTLADGTTASATYKVTCDTTFTALWKDETPHNRVHIYPTTDTAETKAESPKTFDAGVAVYGLMAVSSVLGMGVVGKKKF